MANRLSTPDRLFDRSWRPGHPYAPRLSRGRRWTMTITFIVLTLIIGGYWYITDSNRVRGMAESYLTDVLGGPVKVGRANLSLFEGLRLDDVEVRVDDSNAVDAVIFSAKTFNIQYDPRSMLSGRLEATSIRAIDPHVRLTENVDTRQWNYQRMVRKDTTRPTPPPSMKAIVLPEIILRNAQIDYSEIRDRKFISLGSMAIEGRLSPGTEVGRYAFDLQSRGESEGIGPVISGSVVMGTGQISARMKNFEFGRDIRTMLPAQVRDWWEEHELAGHVDVPKLSYDPEKGGAFNVETDLDNVTLAVHPEEWRGRAENAALESISKMLVGMRALCGSREPVVTSDVAGSIFDHLAVQFQAGPVRLQKVSGKFVFTEDGIDVSEVTGRLETNGFKVSGHIDGYSPQSAASLTIASLDTENIYIPHAPRYVASLPQPVRELYDHLHPEGTCSLWMQINRPTPGARPEVTGQINILDGQFVFDKFPYQVRQATGKILIARDKQSGADRLEIVDLRGHGTDGGPNQKCYMTLNGLVTPLGADSAVTIRIAGTDVSSEPALRDAFPPQVRKALSVFDVKGDGEFPKFHGNFVCDVIRPYGRDQRWQINVDIDIDRASGALVGFPYPLDDVNGRIEIREGHVDLRNIQMKRGQSSLALDGKVSWAPDDLPRAWDDPKNRPLKPELTIKATNVPIDHDLLGALPPDRRAWLEKLGIGGKLDIDGRITGPETQSGDRDPFSYDLNLTLRDGTIWPNDGTFALSNLAGSMRLTPTTLEMHDVTARRGKANLTGSGTILWPHGQPKVDLRANVKELALDASLYGLIPAAARTSWDQVRPEGTVDADIHYTGSVSNASPATAPAASQPSALLQGLRVAVHPRKLSVIPQVVPYRLDDLAGEIDIAPDQVTLTDLSAHHGDAKIKMSGVGNLGEHGSWDLKLSGQDVLVDDDFRKAIPETLSGLLQSLKMWGKIDFDFSKLAYRELVDAPAAPREAPAAKPGATSRPLPTSDVDFATRITMQGAGLDVGVPLADVNGTIDLAGTVRHGVAQELAGIIDIDSLQLAGREAKNFRAKLTKSPTQPALQIGEMQAAIAGGEMAGQVDLAFPDIGPSRYAVSLQLRNADVQKLGGGDEEHEIRGLLNASLAVQGAWGDATSRRGRGDVTVSGKSMYKIPIVLGLLQITNLALPINEPFHDASTRYSLDGNRVTFENIDLRSQNMTMQGHGSLDFGTKKVHMTFFTDNPGMPNIPFVGPLLKVAKQELLQIHVNGTIQEPKVSASSMNTFSTTVDEVFKGDSKK